MTRLWKRADRRAGDRAGDRRPPGAAVGASVAAAITVFVAAIVMMMIDGLTAFLALCACSDQLRRHYNLRQFFINVNLQHLRVFDERLHEAFVASPSDYLPLVRGVCRWRAVPL